MGDGRLGHGQPGSPAKGGNKGEQQGFGVHRAQPWRYLACFHKFVLVLFRVLRYISAMPTLIDNRPSVSFDPAVTGAGRLTALPQQMRGRGARNNDRAATRRTGFRFSMMAGRRWRNCRRSRPRFLKSSPRPSSRATSRRIFPLTARSTPTGAASMAASIAMRGPPTPIWGFRRGSISRASFSSSRTRRRFSGRN